MPSYPLVSFVSDCNIIYYLYAPGVLKGHPTNFLSI